MTAIEILEKGAQLLAKLSLGGNVRQLSMFSQFVIRNAEMQNLKYLILNNAMTEIKQMGKDAHQPAL